MRELGAECAAGLTALQSLAQLTRLAITQADFPISMETVPGIATLTGLRTLQLSLCRLGVDPAVLGPLSQLQELDISFSELLGGPAGMSVLLAWLPKVQHLTHLAISGHQWGMQLGVLSQQAAAGPGAVLAVPPQAYCCTGWMNSLHTHDTAHRVAQHTGECEALPQAPLCYST
jgi:hypothetical protein